MQILYCSMIRMASGFVLSILMVFSHLGIYASETSNVFDIALNIDDNCSVILYWNPTSSASRYTLHYIYGCHLHDWKTAPPIDDTSIVLEDQSLFAACLLGDCYFRITAEVYQEDGSLRNKSGRCVKMDRSFNINRSTNRESFSNFNKKKILQANCTDQCVPIVSLCPNRSLPQFLVDDSLIPWPMNNINYSAHFIPDTRSYNFCFDHRIAPNHTVVLQEVCDINTKCLHCLNVSDNSEQILTSRTEIFVQPAGQNESDSVLNMNKSCCPIPAAIKFCNDSYYIMTTNSAEFEVCLCLPLHYLHEDNDVIEVEITSKEDTKPAIIPAAVTTWLNLTQQCLVVNLTQCNEKPLINMFDICMEIKGTNIRNYMYIPQNCAQVQALEPETDSEYCPSKSSEEPPNESNSPNKKNIAISVVVPFFFILIVVAVIILTVCLAYNHRRSRSGSETFN